MAEEELPIGAFEVQTAPYFLDQSEYGRFHSAGREGTNAVRYGVIGLLNSPGSSALVGLDDELERFGFNRNLLHGEPTDGEFEKMGQFLREAVGLGRQGETNFEEIQNSSWAALIEGASAARLTLLTAGMCNGNERESAAAAVALIGNLNSTFSVEGRDWMGLEAFWRESNALRNYLDFWPFLSGYGYGNLLNVPELFFRTDNSNESIWAYESEWLVRRAIRRSPSTMFLFAALLDIAWLRIRIAQQSTDPVVRQFAEALAFRLERKESFTAQEKSEHRNPARGTHDHFPSTMVHGTWGWQGDWWYPGGSFHDFILKNYRQCLYKGGRPSQWNGSLKENHRELAGMRFKDWVADEDPSLSLCSVFAHSYGADVVAHAINAGIRIQELILLSAPITDLLQNVIPRVGRVMDVRLRTDAVLLLADAQQRSQGGVVHKSFRKGTKVFQVIAGHDYLDHTITHNVQFWKEEDIANRIGL